MTDISPVTPKDIPALLQMIRKLCAFHGDACLMGLSDTQAQFIDGPLVGLIARKNGAVAGYAALEPHWRPMHTGPLLDIAHLFVKEPLRGHGIGKALITAAREQAKRVNACRLVIGTSPVNPGAAAAYRAMGLEEMTGPRGARFEVAL